MTDMGKLHLFLNIRIARTEGFIRMDQSVYAQKVAEKFGSVDGESKEDP